MKNRYSAACLVAAYVLTLLPTVQAWSQEPLDGAEPVPGAQSQEPIDPAEPLRYLPLVESHLERLIREGADIYGPVQTPMWMATLDTRTGRTPDTLYVPERTYRLIGAPGGVSLYWDQPMIAAARLASSITGEPAYADAAEAYVESYLNCCIDEEGLLEWGNHRYYDARGDSVVHFHGGHHELRPIVPAWKLFWQQDPQWTERYIREMVRRHLFDPASGGFNRHDTAEQGLAFLEAGAVLVESLAWLYEKTEDPELLETALRIARYSFGQRDASTGLVPNADSKRWDGEVVTTEIGVWAQSMLRAADYTSENAFLDMARKGLSAYLKYGYDPEVGQYWGQVGVTDGKPVVQEESGYWPGRYADVWNVAQWPTHDYPMAVADAALTLYERTGGDAYRQAVTRWVQAVRARLPARAGSGAYAGHYGATIYFLSKAGRTLDDASLVVLADTVAQEAVQHLYEDGLFEGYPGRQVYASVDGVGYLLLALMYLETGRESDFQTIRF